MQLSRYNVNQRVSPSKQNGFEEGQFLLPVAIELENEYKKRIRASAARRGIRGGIIGLSI